MKQAQSVYEIELMVLFGPFSKYIMVQQKAAHPAWKIREIMSDKETGGKTPPEKLKQKRCSGREQPGKSADTGGKPKAHPKEILDTIYSIMRKPRILPFGGACFLTGVIALDLHPREAKDPG